MFKTEWITILTAGATVDGRNVPQQALEDIAETYDPKKYNSRINVDHSPYSSKLGSVLAVKVEGNELLAVLKPNNILLYFIQQGQKLHTSCEIVSDFAKTGKSYLTGLALTDEPASLGTTELHLSSTSGSEFFSSNETIEQVNDNFLKKLFNKKDETMSDKATVEMLSQIKLSNENTASSIEALTGAINGLVELNKQEASPAENNEESKLTELNQKVTELSESVTNLTSEGETKDAEITALKEKLAKQTDEPNRDEATGGDADDLDDVL